MKHVSAQDLYLRACSYKKVCQLILETSDNSLLQNALENIHLAVELSLKAIISLKGKSYPLTHNLDFLIELVDESEFQENTREKDWTRLQSNIKADRELSKIVWNMDCRYYVIERTAEDLRLAIADYEEFYQWIHQRWLAKLGECLKI